MLPYCFNKPLKNPFPALKTHFFVENPPYKIDTLVYIGSSKDLLKFMYRNYGKDFLSPTIDSNIDFSTSDGITVPCRRKDGSQFILIWLNSFNFSLSDITVLAHEILHATVYVLRISGVHSIILENNGGESDDEHLAYSLGEMFERVMFNLSKKYQKISSSLINSSKK